MERLRSILFEEILSDVTYSYDSCDYTYRSFN